MEKSTLPRSNVTESWNLDWEKFSDLTTSGSEAGDIEYGRQETSRPCWCRSSGVKGTEIFSKSGCEKERVDRGSKEKPVALKPG